MPNATIRVLNAKEVEHVSGGFVCGGLCVLGAIGGGVALYSEAIALGEAWGKAMG